MAVKTPAVLTRHKVSITTTHTALHTVYWSVAALEHGLGAMTPVYVLLAVLTIIVHMLNEEDHP